MNAPYSPLENEPGIEKQAFPASRLERVFGKSSKEWTTKDLLSLVREHGIRLVSLMHIGGDGCLKTLDFVPRDYIHLQGILTAGERADGSSLFGMLGIRSGKSDIVIRPQLETAFINPFSPVPTLSLICGHVGQDGEALPESPDTILRRGYQRAIENGADLHAFGEVEFFLGRDKDQADMYGSDDRGYHATSPFVFGEELRRKAMVLLAEMGVPIKYAHSEVGYVEASGDDPTIWEQHELELSLAPLPRAAEAVSLTIWVLRNLARQAEMRCSFDPILRSGHAGSGMHFHVSPVVDGAHSGGETPEGELMDPAKHMIAGLSLIGGALMAFGNRDESSFMRLTQGKEVPNTMTWGKYNRKVLIRLPMLARDSCGNPVSPATIEFRLPDGSAHPHLLLAGIAQAYVAGAQMKNVDAFLAKSSADGHQDMEELRKIPHNMAQISDALKTHRDSLVAGQVYPEHVIDEMIHQLAEI